MPQEPFLTAKKLLALAPQMVERIAEYRFEQRIHSESEAMRRLIDAGLNGGAEPQQHAHVHAQPRPLRALLTAYYSAALAADPGIALDGDTPDGEADAELRRLGTLILGWATENGIAADRDGLAAPVFEALGALVPVPADEDLDQREAA